MANQIDIITTSLEALIQRATNVNNQGPDTAAIDAFCGLVNREPECTQMAAKLITAKVHSLQEWEALQALLVLETCLKRCTNHFLFEVGKFRFLNELIKLVSPKYLGAHTPESVRRRVLELMHSWTLSFPKEIKIKEAYDMLKKQGVVKEDPIVQQHKDTVASKHQASILQDEEKSQLLQKLLQSKNPQDLQAANRLIKTMVKEEERRNEEKWRNHMELETVVNNCRLLSEMLDSFQEGVTSDQELELIKELYNTCQNLRPALFKLATTNSDPGFCHDVLTVNDELGEVFARYNGLIKSHPSTLPTSTSQMLQPKADQPSSSLLDLSPSPTDQPTSSSKDLTDLEIDLSVNEASKNVNPPPNLTDILKDVFADNILPGISAPLIQDQNQIGMESLVPQQPSVPFNKSQTTLLSSSKPSGDANVTPAKPKGFEELDLLSKMLMEQSLSSIASSQNTEGDATSDLKAESLPVNRVTAEPEPCDDDLLLNLGSWTSGSEKTDGNHVDEVTSKSLDLPNPATSSSSNSTPLRLKEHAKEEKPLPLGDISLSIEAIRPSGIPPFLGLEERNGISTVIHLAKDCPRPDVSVYVVTTSSKNQSAVTNFLFQPIVPKFCRLRLLPPSVTALPPHNPFLPPAAITQVMLIASHTKEPIPLKFVISYSMDEETFTEMCEIDRLLMTED
ncbi:hypothetical protein GE061_002695 [Apolygus lucorum]|uniref:VHS domain-containing protein n=1 Tax=Apolygus lucorum TaxID=248454 RepID=A0A6A4IQ23_APOLU|nr:hypothetical protein GE061_002695 [Apolygus lucorum]